MQGSKANEGFNIEYLETKTLYIAFGAGMSLGYWEIGECSGPTC